MTRAHTTTLRSTIIGGTALVAAALIAVAAPLAAAAHVTVGPGQVESGSWSTLTFTVPNESATAGTVKLEVLLPTDTPFTSVSYQPLTGWSAQIDTEKLAQPVEMYGASITEAPSKITWTADADTSITKGQFQQFVISVGPVPETGRILLPALQTYSDGSVVEWGEQASADGTEPEHPAPTLYVNDQPADGGHVDSDEGATVTPTVPESSETNAAETNAAETDDTDTSAEGPAAQPGESGEFGVSLWVAFAGLGLAAIALVVAVAAIAGRNRAGSGAGTGGVTK